MNAHSPLPIAVVGGGAIGIACALGLTKWYAPVLLIGGQTKPPLAVDDAWDSRTYALNRNACNCLQQLDVLPHIKRNGVFEALRVWDEQGSSLHFSATDIGVSNLGIVVEHRILMDALQAQLQSVPAIEHVAKDLAAIDFPNGDKEACRLIFADGDTCDVSFVIGADGARSIVREQAGIKWQQKDYQQVAQAAIVQTQQDHRNTCWQQFSPSDGISALLPLGDHNTCSAIWSHSHAATPAEMECLFSQAMGLGKVQLLSQPITFPLYGGIAKNYITPHCLLVGDAAHNIHPLAGQGANLGFRDLSALFQSLQHSPARRLSLPVLRRYQRTVTLHNAVIKTSIEMMLCVSGRQDCISTKLRRLVSDVVGQNTALRSVFLHRAS